jgi:AcrR family transcriptional regulator
LAAFDLFVLVCLVCFILYRYFEARDARIKAVHEDYLGARYKLMMAAKGYQVGRVPDIRAAIEEMVLLGQASLQAFEKAKALLPDLEPDGDWTNTLLWVKSKARLIGLK